MGEGDARYQRYIDDQHAPRTPASNISGGHRFSIGLYAMRKAEHNAHTLAEGVKRSALNSQTLLGDARRAAGQ